MQACLLPSAFQAIYSKHSFTISALLSIFWSKKSDVAWLSLGCKIPCADDYCPENNSYHKQPRIIFEPHKKSEFDSQIKVDAFIPVVLEEAVFYQHECQMKRCYGHQKVIKEKEFTKIDVVENNYHSQRYLV